jgi:quercetin dioxygenase-like cupin family protein
MKRAWMIAGLAGAVLLAWSIGFVHGQEKKAADAKVVFVNPEEAKFTQVVPGVTKAPVWGDDQGPYGAFTKFAPGQDNGMHTHTNDIWIVVIKGAYLFKDDAGEKRVGPGCFIRVPGGHPHWSGGDAKEGALFYEEGAGKFDLVPAK